jgi:O-acetylhomoserine (thiol)-lyase
MAGHGEIETVCLHGGHEAHGASPSRAVPIHQTTSYVFRDADHAASLFDLREAGHIYTRISNPTTEVLEARMAMLEGGAAALAVASGQAAATLAFLTLCESGDEIVSSSKIYGGTFNLLSTTLARLGIATRFVGSPDPSRIRAAITCKTRAVFVEAVGNPSGEVADLPALADVAHQRGVPLAVDATTATPVLCRPIEHGADIVIHSATKFIGGHGTSIGGIVVDSGLFPWDNGRFPRMTEPSEGYHGLRFWEAFRGDAGTNLAFTARARAELLRDLGPALSPFNAFLFLQGLETLPLRMERHCQNAMAVARWLERHPKVAWVSYPGLESHPSYEAARRMLRGGFGAILTFAAAGGYEVSRRIPEKVRLISHLANIGDSRTLIIHPASTTHRQLSTEERRAAGIADDMVRLSVGLEHVQDICADLDRALEGTCAGSEQERKARSRRLRR